ncbi:helix-turn-helix domain-containing protein [Nocardia sp. NPDC004278]
MAWSTRELAELAGTSLRTVRHYHDVGLLAEPERAANGYKRYGVTHLVRLLRIKKLTALGFSLAQIAALGAADEHPEAELRALDTELAATIERLQRARSELALILRHGSPTDLPPELAPTAGGLSAADRAFISVITRALDPSAFDAYKRMLQSLPGALPAGPELDDLPADADEQARIALAERLIPQVRDLYANYPGLQNLGTGGNAHSVTRAIGAAMTELYNAAQIDVLRRIGLGLQAPRPIPK